MKYAQVLLVHFRRYTVHNIVTPNDYKRLSSLLWLSGSLNWNFVKKTLSVLEDARQLEEHLKVYRVRERGCLHY